MRKGINLVGCCKDWLVVKNDKGDYAPFGGYEWWVGGGVSIQVGWWERRMSGASFGGHEWWLKLTCGLGQDCEAVETWSEGETGID